MTAVMRTWRCGGPLLAALLLCTACSSAGPAPGPTAPSSSHVAVGTGPPPTNGAPAPGQTTDAVAPPTPPTSAHPFARYLVTGARSGVRAPVLVRLPAAYFDPAQSGRRFPVIETFHGAPGHAEQWLGKLHFGQALDQSMREGRIAAAIVVSPSMNYPTDGDRECVDAGPPAPALETWATQDVPDWVEHTFRARSDRNSWATIGLSAGGWCAAMASMLHPDRYRASAVLSGYFRPQFPGPSPLVAGPRARRYDLVALAGTAPPPVALWLVTSPEDGASFATSRAVSFARPPLAVTSVVLHGQDHSWRVWSGLLPGILAWLGRTASGFAPPTSVARPSSAL